MDSREEQLEASFQLEDEQDAASQASREDVDDAQVDAQEEEAEQGDDDDREGTPAGSEASHASHASGRHSGDGPDEATEEGEAHAAGSPPTTAASSFWSGTGSALPTPPAASQSMRADSQLAASAADAAVESEAAGAAAPGSALSSLSSLSGTTRSEATSTLPSQAAAPPPSSKPSTPPTASAPASTHPTPPTPPTPAAPSETVRQAAAPPPSVGGGVFAPMAGSTHSRALAPHEQEEEQADAGPRYQRPTQVLPKAPLQEYMNADVEHIASVFSTGTALGRGIRSLPDAFSPDFRQRLYEEMLDAGRRERSGQTKGPSQAPAAALPLAPGQRQVPKVHPYSGTFTSYEYMPSEYDRKTIITKFERLKNKLQQVTPTDFVVKAPPMGPKGAPAFSEFEYDLDPFANADTARSADTYAARVNVLSGPFLAGGKIDASVNLRGLADECMLSLCKQLSKDWPAAFLQVFEDSSGALVLCFDKVQAVSEGDLSSYMQNLVKTGRVVAEFKLVKDAAQWGLMDDETMSCFFVFWPPWVRHRFLGASKTAPSGTQAFAKV